MSETSTLIGFMVNDAASLPCLLYRYRRELWVRRTDDVCGLGIGHYTEGSALLRTQSGLVKEDISFSDLIRKKGTRLLVAHASLSTVPTLDLEGIQPFRWRNWLFANSMLDLGDHCAKILDALPGFLLRSRKGYQDGEILFLHFLALLHKKRLFDCRAKAQDLASHLHEAATVSRSSANILTSNGHVLLAYRSGSPLFYRRFIGIENCERCSGGGSSKHFGPAAKSHQLFKGICIASRPFGEHDQWNEIPDGHMLAIQPSLDFTLASELE
ncbi:MAG: hypothetical protein GY847_31665 [Proteobacteria bacterium]|nr:hypothetical protein [Pseudomonadota bacterium]